MLANIQKNKNPQKEKGLAYVAILLLVAIMSATGLTFLAKSRILSSATSNYADGMQAEYLAESAVNHARWGLLNVPGFAPDPTIYYMHSFASGRYGYKIRRPTLTTFATVATVGAMGDNVVQQGYVPYFLPSNIMTAYGQNNNTIPQCRRLVGADWSVPFDSVDVLKQPIRWVDLEGCPVREEFVMGTIDEDHDINLAVWQDGTWTGPWEFSIDVDRNYKCFDIAYESQANRALIVGRYDDTTAVRYNIWDGTAWSFVNPPVAFNLTEGKLHTLAMEAQPGGDQILIAAVSDKKYLEMFLWTGSSFMFLGKIEGETEMSTFGIVKIVYEQQSGDALILWSEKDSTAISYRIWDGCELSATNYLPSIGAEALIIRADADPTSDYIFVVAIDKDHDINVAVWDGVSWIDSRELEIDGEHETDPVCFDAAWERSGNEVLVVWGQNGQEQIRYFPWTKGTLLSSGTVSIGPDFLKRIRGTYLLPIYGSDRIILLANNKDKDIRYCMWTGTRLLPDPSVVLELDMGRDDRLPFDVAEMLVPRNGGSGSGTCIHFPPTVYAGPDQTINFPSDATLDGIVTDDGLPDPPATVTTTWTQESGPGTVTFGDASLIDTTATFSEAGTYVLRLTADDSDLTAFDEITITVSFCLGLVGYWELDETSGTLASDSSGNGNDGTLMDMDPSTDWVSGQLDGGLDFDGINDVVDLGSALELEDIFDGGGTAAAWIYPIGWGEGGAGRIFSKQDAVAGNHSGWEFSTWGTANSLIFQRGFSSTIGSWEATTNSLSLNTWQHVAIVYDGSSDANEPTFYINSIPQTTIEIFDPPSGSPLSDAGMKLSLGNVIVDTGRTFDGIIDDARIYNRMLDSSEIAQLHAMTEGGCGGSGGSCEADYTPDTMVGEFSTATYGSNDTQSITYFPTGMTFNGVTAPAGGAWISVDTTDDLLYMTDINGNLLTSVATATSSMKGVSLVTTGASANHLATVDSGLNRLTYVDMDGNGVAQLLLGTHGVGQAAGVGFIETTVSGTYDGHIAVADRTTESVYVITQGNTLATTIDVNDGTAASLQDVGHLPGTDKIIIPYLNEVRIYDLNGTLVRQYDTTTFGMGDLESVAINPNNCDHVVTDKGIDAVMYLNTGGGGSDTDPPTPDPMTWASPPAPAGPTSITMTATTATDPSGVKYYFECTAGGGNDSGWIDDPTYVDTGLTPNTSYTYRVKATDKAVPPNETGWSTEESATTPTAPDMFVNDITMGFRKSGQNYYGQATVWIKDEWGNDVSGALVTGDWSGAVSGGEMGTTGGSGKIFFESPEKKFGGTFTFTVTDVTKSGYVYNPALNVMTSNSITAP